MNDLVRIDVPSAIEADGEKLPGEIASLSIDDCHYILIKTKCSRCDRDHYRILRSAGVFISWYILPEDFLPEGFADFVSWAHQSMLIDRRSVIAEARHNINERSYSNAIENDGNYCDQLMDVARLRFVMLQRLGAMEAIDTVEPKDDTGRALAAAFELGYAISEMRLTESYANAIYEGMRLQEGRQAGQVAAADAKARTTRRRRAAIRKACSQLHGNDPALAYNDAATARAIARLGLPELCRAGRSIGHEAIVKHLREIRNERKLEEIS